MNIIFNIFKCICGIGLIDIFLFIILKLNGHVDKKARWFLLHSICNICIISVCYDEVITVFTNPLYSYIIKTNFYGYYIAIALHVYHALIYNITYQDLFHHIIFVLIGGSYTLYFQPYIASSCGLVSLCGIPGAIDYFLLSCVRLGYIDKGFEKKVNAFLNCWFRMPYGIFLSGMGFVCIITYSKWECIPCLLFITYNSLYYGRMAIINNDRYIQKKLK